MDNTPKSLLSFMIGSPQAFIESARTLRDLWSGSYLISWIVAHAMKPVHRAQPDWKAEFVTPHVDPTTNALLAAVLGTERESPLAILPSIPNKFTAIVATDYADQLARLCVTAAEAQWKNLCNEVKQGLSGRLPNSTDEDWCEHWDEQIASFFEFTAVTRPMTSMDDNAWNGEWDELGKLMEMTRAVRHVPNYGPKAEEYPPKCSLLGSYEQMGPAKLSVSREFWRSAAKWRGIEGTRLQNVDRLCAVSLVKRFAWPLVLADATGLEKRVQRYSDTATIAAKIWLGNAGINPDVERSKHGKWSGQWLHWDAANQDDDEEECPSELFRTIREMRHPMKLGGAPIYYAILHLDGDNMGEFFRGHAGENGRGRYQIVTEKLTGFGGSVVEIVKRHQGELIYCGGDDILALLPTVTSVACAQELNDCFQKNLEDLEDKVKASLSGGLAVVHYKEDLRYALNVVRKAEKSAKRIDQTPSRSRKPDEPPKKQALAVAVCRHSGEHSQFVMGWSEAGLFQSLVDQFQEEFTDRWTYKLREVQPILRELPLKAMSGEIARLLSRIEGPNAEKKTRFVDCVKELWCSYSNSMKKGGNGREWPDPEIFDHFVTLCQSASFMARGRD